MVGNVEFETIQEARLSAGYFWDQIFAPVLTGQSWKIGTARKAATALARLWPAEKEAL